MIRASDFESYFFDKKPKLNVELIKTLLIGDKKYKGLIHYCGKIDEGNTHFTCTLGLKILCKLLEYEHNKGKAVVEACLISV